MDLNKQPSTWADEIFNTCIESYMILHRQVLLTMITLCCCAPLGAERNWRQKIELAPVKRVVGMLDALEQTLR